MNEVALKDIVARARKQRQRILVLFGRHSDREAFKVEMANATDIAIALQRMVRLP